MDPVVLVGIVSVAVAVVVIFAIVRMRRERPVAPPRERFAAQSEDRTMVGDFRAPAPRAAGDDRTVVGDMRAPAAPAGHDDRTVVGVQPAAAPPEATMVVRRAEAREEVTAPTVVVRRAPRARVSVTKGGPAGPFELQPREYVIGRSAASDIVLTDPSVSGRHARLVPQGDGFAVEDLGSTNGTTVAGKPAHGLVSLRGDEVIGIGEATLRYELIR